MDQHIIGSSNLLLQTLDKVSLLAPIERPLLVLGERGTGKELITQRLHFLSGRWQGPLLQVNCAALNDNLLESELFGHEAGAFTGANRQHQGKFEQANGGTLILDELGTMSLRLQEKLLRVLEYGQFERVGGHQSVSVDVRVIGATNANLAEMAQVQAFRADLLDRLSFDAIHVPPLRLRGDDILELAEHFALRLCHELGNDVFSGFSKSAKKSLSHYPWPGNIRELRNVVERSIVHWLAQDHPAHKPVNALHFDVLNAPFPTTVTTTTSDLETAPADTQAQYEEQAQSSRPSTGHQLSNHPSQHPSLKEQVLAHEKQLLQSALLANQHHQSRTAQALGISYHQLRGLLKKHAL